MAAREGGREGGRKGGRISGERSSTGRTGISEAAEDKEAREGWKEERKKVINGTDNR